MHGMSANVRGLIVSLIFGLIILGYSILFYEFKTVPLEVLTVGLLLMVSYVITVVESWKDKLWGFFAAAGICVVGIYVALQDPALATFLFKDGVITPLFLADLFFITTQAAALYFSIISFSEKMWPERFKLSLLVHGGDLYE